MLSQQHACAAGAAFVIGLLVSASARADTYVQIATHPDAVLQSTAAGRMLHTLHPVDGKLFVGYGDYNANTGPITIRYYDPAADAGAGAWSDALVTGNTEAFHRFRTIDGSVYAPHTDALGGTWAGYASGLPSGASWSDYNGLQNIHLFDMAGYNGRLFIAGAGGPTHNYNAIVYSSGDSGATWQVSLDLDTPDPDWDGVEDTTYSFSRFYGVAPLNGKLYVQPVDYYYDQPAGGGSTSLGADTRELMVLDESGTWSEGPLLRTSDGIRTAFYDPEEVAGRLVIRNGHPGLSGQRMFWFDGEQIVEIAQTRTDTGAQALFFDHYVDEQDRLFVLRNDRYVLMTEDLVNWTTVATGVPITTRSIAVIDDYLYIGAVDAGLWRMTTPIPEPAFATVLAAGLLLLRRRR